MSTNQLITTPPRKTSQRLWYIDNLRVIACFLVLLTHSTISSDPEGESFWMFTLSFIGSPSSELFLALSGTVLLPIKTDIRNFYSRRFWKLLPPVIFWSIFGALLYIPLYGHTWENALTKILYMPLQPAFGVYWFIYVMIGLYLFAPVISAYLREATKKQCELFLLLWGVTLFMPYFYALLSKSFNQSGDYYWTLNYFGGFIGYWVLGYYLNKYPIKIGFNRKWLSLCVLTLVYPLSIAFIKLKGYDITEFTDNLQLGSAVLVAVLYTIVQNINFSQKIQSFLTSIAKFSFGIYLIHFFTRELFWHIFAECKLHTFPLTFLIAIMMMALCWSIVWVISKLPFGKYITGT